ncbi:hypothetical protein B5807_05809 [Epicoccum nigrum]|jgi:hypothetical protein|uniref:Uncharacterized protein n=1 Tax=Epicoccum nigrum TaxID=105696 RepID=A0A1Y2M0B2_EPING|nr:hypothetical protein B5807_05809 [Epicoccum nigrum]
MSCGFSRVSLTKYFVDHPAEQRLKLFRRRQRPPVELVTQNRRIRYIERPALEHFLSTRFGDGNFAVEVSPPFHSRTALETNISTDEGGPVGYQDPKGRDHNRCKSNQLVAYKKETD